MFLYQVCYESSEDWNDFVCLKENMLTFSARPYQSLNDLFISAMASFVSKIDKVFLSTGSVVANKSVAFGP